MKNMSTLQNTQYTPYRPITYSGDSPPHTLVINASYELPFGSRKKFLNSGNPALQAVLGGWNLAGYFRYSDGSALSFSATNNLSVLGYGATSPITCRRTIFGVTSPVTSIPLSRAISLRPVPL
jgi:hypothetical protein